MVSSRRGIRRFLPSAPAAFAAVACCAMALCFACCLLAPKVAHAAEGTPVVSVTSVNVGLFGIGSTSSLSESACDMTLPRFAPSVLSPAFTPEVIQVGKDCGMDWMCGITPCLCGSSDSWGGCSCNGLQDERPTYQAVSSDEGVVKVASAIGMTWLVPTGVGCADVTVTPSLRYHNGESAVIHVQVDGLQAADALVAGLVAVLVAAIVGMVVFVLRKKGRCVK